MNIQEVAEQLGQQMDAEEANPEVEQETVDSPEELDAEAESPEQESMEAESVETEEVESEDESEQTEESAWMPSTLEDLAEGLEVDQDVIKTIRVRTKVDGVEGEATLADLIKNYQIDKSLTNKSESLAKQRQEFETTYQSKIEQLQERLAKVDAAAEALNQEIETEVGNIDWQRLREEDPAEYALKRQDMIEKISMIERRKQEAHDSAKQQAAELQQEQQKQHQQRLVQEQNALLEKVPEWRDESVRTKELADIGQYLRGVGFSDAEIAGVWRHEMVLIARDAMMRNKAISEAHPERKKVKLKPKFVKPGARQDKGATAQKVHNAKISKLKKTGSIQDAAAILLDRYE